jgi:RNA polymerase-binding transcription factor DksA
MPGEEHRSPAAIARVLPAGTRGPHWRAILEVRWQALLEEVTELSLAYHDTAAVPDGRGNGAGQREAQRLLRCAVTARRKLADVEEALGRLAAGSFGYCEQCGSAIPAALLTSVPEARYCPCCTDEPTPARRPAVAGRSLR